MEKKLLSLAPSNTSLSQTHSQSFEFLLLHLRVSDVGNSIGRDVVIPLKEGDEVYVGKDIHDNDSEGETSLVLHDTGVKDHHATITCDFKPLPQREWCCSFTWTRIDHAPTAKNDRDVRRNRSLKIKKNDRFQIGSSVVEFRYCRKGVGRGFLEKRNVFKTMTQSTKAQLEEEEKEKKERKQKRKAETKMDDSNTFDIEDSSDEEILGGSVKTIEKKKSVENVQPHQVICPSCGMDITKLSKFRKLRHTHACEVKRRNNAEEQKFASAKSIRKDSISSTTSTTANTSCFICGKNFSRMKEKGRLSHLKSCGKSHGIATRMLVNMVSEVVNPSSAQKLSQMDDDDESKDSVNTDEINTTDAISNNIVENDSSKKEQVRKSDVGSISGSALIDIQPSSDEETPDEKSNNENKELPIPNTPNPLPRSQESNFNDFVGKNPSGLGSSKRMQLNRSTSVPATPTLNSNKILINKKKSSKDDSSTVVDMDWNAFKCTSNNQTKKAVADQNRLHMRFASLIDKEDSSDDDFETPIVPRHRHKINLENPVVVTIDEPVTSVNDKNNNNITGNGNEKCTSMQKDDISGNETDVIDTIIFDTKEESIEKEKKKKEERKQKRKERKERKKKLKKRKKSGSNTPTSESEQQQQNNDNGELNDFQK
eukprot:TRINITY_DN425_c0_g1_i3.p1 TRINITY_DN425_c0_g1~~TRINITY_DN425_c0_g1_i3.p1  ORF type:complete len:653 (-),score=208.68 TRINITY_DN425_c0_g1_i3:154-2112(-)